MDVGGEMSGRLTGRRGDSGGQAHDLGEKGKGTSSMERNLT